MIKFKILKVNLWILFLFSCGSNIGNKDNYDAQIDVRFGNKFYSILINEKGEGYVVKGVGSDYKLPLKIKYSRKSKTFQLDSVKFFYKKLSEIKNNPHIVISNVTDAPRTQIFCKKKLIYDSFNWNEEFIGLIEQIISQLPHGFNPFLTSEHPFDN